MGKKNVSKKRLKQKSGKKHAFGGYAKVKTSSGYKMKKV
jgi:hypothetical protein